MSELLLVAGEASGDLHGARLLGELRALDPTVQAFGLGGDELAQTGLRCLAHSREVAVVGITEILKILPRARQVFRALLDEVDRRRPAAAVLVDFPEFNLRRAKELKRRGIPVVYYVSPQIWAWRKGRVRQIARRVDRMLVLFGFEVDFYQGHAVDAVHVGHPLVDEVPELPQVWEQGPPTDGPFRIALLPGSRRSEIEALLPTMLEAFRLLADRLPVTGRLIRAATVDRELLEEKVQLAGVPVEIVSDDRYQSLSRSHLALCASGTATLELGLLGTPMVVTYRVGQWTYRLARLLVDLPAISLVNLVLERPAVPELIQDAANPENLARTAADLLEDPAGIASMRSALAEIRGRLGQGGASVRAAEEVLDVLRRGSAP